MSFMTQYSADVKRKYGEMLSCMFYPSRQMRSEFDVRHHCLHGENECQIDKDGGFALFLKISK